jgi:DNA-binding SARP family transcriptional activator
LILAYVALRPQRTACRDHIAQLFWPGTPLSQARNSLRQSLYRLRQAAGDGELIKVTDAVVRCSPNIRFDCLEVEEALAAENWEQAWTLLRGPFLEAVRIPEAKELEDWMESERSRFRECEFRVGEAMIEVAFADDRAADAITVAERLKATDPADERRIRVLMDVLDRCGQARRALAEYRSFASLMSNGFDDEPTPELQVYARDLERSLERPVDDTLTTIPFVGRSSAWARLLDRWSKAEKRESGLVLIEGDLGLGKTRLIEEFATRAKAGGALWLSGKCYDIEQTLPFALISDLIQSPRRPETLRVADQQSSDSELPEPPDLLAISDSSPLKGKGIHQPNGSLPLYAGVAEWLIRVTADQALILTCDDIHWADAASLQFLHWLSHRLRGAPVLLVCSYRPAELSPDARTFAGSIASEGLGDLVTLEPLTAADVREILSNLGRFQDEALADSLAVDLREHTDGNPLFIAELLEALQRADVLTLEAGEWKPATSLRHEQLPGRLRNILSDKIDRLSPDPRFLLEVMAVVADAVEADAIAPVIGRSGPATEAMLAELRKARLVRSRPFGRYEVAHDELRNVVYTSITDDRRRDIHAKVGRALEAWGEALRPGGGARLAHHFEQAGETAQARQHALAAAREAASVGATESQASFLKLAEAYGAGERPVEDPSPASPARRSRRSRWLAAAALVTVAIATAVILGGHSSRSAGASTPLQPWHQGTLYLAERQSNGDATPVGSFFRVVWPDLPDEQADINPVEEWPAELPPPLLARLVDFEGERHAKIYRVEGNDTIRLTWGRTDDGGATWSPDRRLIALQRGWRAGSDYVYNLFVINRAGEEVWRVTDGPFQDELLDWSPDGSRIAFRRNTGGRYSLWVADADGLREERLLEIGDSERTALHAAFSPDGSRLAASDESGSGLLIIDLERQLRQRISVGCQLVSSRLLWSPDGRWLVTACTLADVRTLMAMSATGRGGPFPIVTLPSPAWGLSHWAGDRPGPVGTVRIRPRPIVLGRGEGKRIVVEASDTAGRPLPIPLRWETTDSSIAAVDEHGFVRGRGQGVARLLASAGGFVADTAEVRVIRAPVDTLLYETWDGGIDEARWMIVGDPAPTTVPGAGPDGGPVFLSNGDFNFPSGVVTRREFDLSGGLTVEFPAYLKFTGEHWQELEASIVPLSKALTPEHERSLVHLKVLGQSPTYLSPKYDCRDGQGHGLGSQAWSAASDSPGWYDVSLQVRPDGYLECYLNGERIGVHAISEPLRTDRAAVFVGGRSHRTKIYHGPLLVTRGLRY